VEKGQEKVWGRKKEKRDWGRGSQNPPLDAKFSKKGVSNMQGKPQGLSRPTESTEGV